MNDNLESVHQQKSCKGKLQSQEKEGLAWKEKIEFDVFIQ